MEPEPGSPTRLSIVIVSYNTEGLLRDCLASLGESEARGSETIVIDNASADGSADMVEREFPSLLLVRNRDNVGFGRASNQGMRLAKGSNMLLLNSDTIVRRG